MSAKSHSSVAFKMVFMCVFKSNIKRGKTKFLFSLFKKQKLLGKKKHDARHIMMFYMQKGMMESDTRR